MTVILPTTILITTHKPTTFYLASSAFFWFSDSAPFPQTPPQNAPPPLECTPSCRVHPLHKTATFSVECNNPYRVQTFLYSATLRLSASLPVECSPSEKNCSPPVECNLSKNCNRSRSATAPEECEPSPKVVSSDRRSGHPRGSRGVEHSLPSCW